MITLDSDPDVLDAMAEGTKLARRVCACGHAEARHAEAMGRTMCEALRGACPCRDRRLVMEVSDTRIFMFSPKGQVHPLIAGVLTTRKRDGEWAWLLGYGSCEFREAGRAHCNAAAKTAVYLDDGKTSTLRCEEHG